MRVHAHALRVWASHCHHLLLVDRVHIWSQVVSSIQGIFWLLENFPCRKEHGIKIIQMHLLKLRVVLLRTIVGLVCMLPV